MLLDVEATLDAVNENDGEEEAREEGEGREPREQGEGREGGVTLVLRGDAHVTLDGAGSLLRWRTGVHVPGGGAALLATSLPDGPGDGSELVLLVRARAVGVEE